MDQGNRRRTRVQGNFKGALTIEGRDVDITTLNLSLKGMLCTVDNPGEMPETGSECRVSIPLSGEITVSVLGVVVRTTETEAAVDFTGMDGDSYTHLRNMVRFASPDADEIDREQTIQPFI